MLDWPVQWRKMVLGCLVVAAAVSCFLLPPIQQDPAYHAFADQRTVAGIPNFADVVSNVFFLIAGLSGLTVVIPALRQRTDDRLHPHEAWPYAVFFAGVALTCLGSAYYHWYPTNARLVWDRLPMSIAFMGLLAATISERVSRGLGQASLVPLVMLGIFSVLSWAWTESRGYGDLRVYIAVQYLSLVMIVVLGLMLTSPYTHAGRLLVGVVVYVAAKVCELSDQPMLEAVGISGHTLKHMIAAASVLVIVQMLRRRRPREASLVAAIA